MTIGQAISRIKNDLKLLNKDDRRSSRYIFSVLVSIATTYIVRKLGERSLDNEENLYTWSEPIDMTEVSIVDTPLVEFRTCNVVMRSKKKLPDLLYSKYGGSIRAVTNLDKSMLIKKADLKQMLRNKDRRIKDRNPIYYIQDGYLWIANSSIESVLTNYLSLYPTEDSCLSAQEQEFRVPQKIEDDIFKGVLNELMSSTMRVVEDTNPNMDNNQKSQTIQ